MLYNFKLRLSQGDKIISQWNSSFDIVPELSSDLMSVDMIDLNGDSKDEILFVFFVDNYRTNSGL